MATPRRRSSRLHGNATPTYPTAMPSPSKLSSLLERDESPQYTQPSIDALVSPIAPRNTVVSQNQRNNVSELKTPPTATRVHPSMGKMHPSKVHQSIDKLATMAFGKEDGAVSQCMTAPTSKNLPSSAAKATPTKSRGSLPNHMSSPGFDFSFDQPETDLSADAQKIMEGVREQAARIKARMQEERDKQQQKDGETDQLYGVEGRKIAKSKGKSGRYSDAHKQQFKKMDSIANHVSTWKKNVPASNKSLKRSGSKAELEDPPKSKALSKSTSSKSLRSVAESDRLENTASGKRAKKSANDDTSTCRPISQDAEDSAPQGSMSSTVAVNLPNAITTPTKASLARAASVKSSKTSMIPSLSRSNSTKTVASPSKSEGGNKYLSSLARFGNVKSILSRRQPKFSNDPVMIAAGTHLPLPQGKVNLSESPLGKVDFNKELPNIPGAFPPSEERAPNVKRVLFTPNTKPSQDLAITPSPSKIPVHNTQNPNTEPSTSSDSGTYSRFPAFKIYAFGSQKQSLDCTVHNTLSINLTARSTLEMLTPSPSTVAYPSFVNSPNVTHRLTKSRETPLALASLIKTTGTPSPSKPTDFTFTSSRTLNFSAPAPVSKLKFGASTIRQVRPSGITTPLAPFDTADMVAIPHGMANKKRKHADPDDENLENEAPYATEAGGRPQENQEDGEDGPRAKRAKMTPKVGASPQKVNGGSRIPKLGGATPKGKGKGVLSLSRLNMLARPRERR